MSSSVLNLAEFPVSFPTPQAQSSDTFHPPPVDGTRALPELYEYNAEHSPDHPLFAFADDSGATRTIKYPEAWRMIQRAAKIAHGYVAKHQGHYSTQGSEIPMTPPTVGILANADYISYISTILATMRLGMTPFPLSTRNSPIAVAHLIKKTHILQLFVSPDPAMQRLCREALEILKQDGIDVEVLPMIQFEVISDESAQAAELDKATVTLPKIDLNTTALILHSSGTTSFPKPISIAHRKLLQWSLLPFYGDVDVCGTLLAVHTCPLFHAMGMCTILFSVVPGMIMACFKPSSPPIIPTPDVFLSNVIQTKSEIVFCVPSFIEAWAKDPAKLSSIKSLRSITYAGAPMTQSVGDQITKMGIKLYPIYGLTETYLVSRLFSSAMPSVDTWECFEFAPHIEYELLPQEGREDMFEVCIIDAKDHPTSAVNATSKDGRPMYRTSDIIQRHPVYPNKWRVHGRADDQIMLATGEKTNPGPLEAILAQDPHVSHAIMFGRGQIQNGILVDPKKEFAFDPSDEAKLVDFRNIIWPTVEKMNEFAPAHSRLFKEMIIVSSPSKPFELTSKGTPRRHIIIKNYEPDIQALYDAVKDSSQTDIPAPQAWDRPSVQDFTREVVQRVMDMDLPDDADFFQQGCDSLQATYIRNSIIHAIREAPNSERIRLSNNFVYENPTISSLASSICSLFSSDGQGNGDKRERDAKVMEAMVEKFSVDFPIHTPRGAPAARSLDEVVFVSGTSGRLGAHLLVQLLARPSVKRVYAVNRPSKVNVKERQRETFESWELDTGLLESGRVVLVEAEFSKAGLGIGEALYNEIRDSVTSIIHNAWRVDFNLAVSSFEPLVAGMRNLIDLSLASPRPSPPPILFTSSISVIMSHTVYPVPEEPITDTKIAAMSGYSESKWVSESLLLRVREQRGLCTNVVRVGQMSGDLKTGGWNKQEWVPVLLRGSQVLGAVPERVEGVSFIPVDVAASTLLDMLGSSKPVLHLVHPYTVPWTVISETASRVLNIPIIRYNEWLSRLQDAVRNSSNDSDAPKHNPALKLIDFYEKDMPEVSPLVIGTDKAVKVSRSLREAKKMDSEEVERWIGYWKKVSLLQ